jgi:hypothetical protein
MVTQLYDDALRPTGLRAIQFTLLQALNLAPGACAELCACTKNQHTVPSVATSLNRTTASSVVPLSAFSSPWPAPTSDGVVYYWTEHGVLRARRLNEGLPYWITLNAADEQTLRDWVHNSSRISSVS